MEPEITIPEDTSGFYKRDNGELLFAPNFVVHKDYKLLREEHESYTYPVDGWRWFDSEEACLLEGW